MPRLLAWCVVLVLAAAGCRVDVFAGVEVDNDGRGHVEAGVGLDDDALARLGDLSAGLHVEDLRRAGWEVTGPEREGDGLTWVRVRKGFETPEEAAAAFRDLGGAAGPFRDLRVTRERSRFRTTTRLAGTVDLTAGVEAFSDPGLRERLGGQAFGVDPAELERQAGAPLAEVVRVQVAARLPGDVESNAPETTAGGAAVWSPRLGERLELRASSSALEARPVALAAGSAAAGLALLAVLAVRGRRWWRSRRVGAA